MSAPAWLTDGASEVRKAQIERDWQYSRRAIRDARQLVAAKRDTIDAEWNALETPPLTIADHIAAVRARVGDEQWNKMKGEG